jgi:uncharacterized protein
MKLGLISDTHNYLDPRVPKIFSGVDHILHAGDVGLPMLIAELEEIAPVTAVVGNTDEGLPLRETEVVVLGGKRFLLHHIVTPGAAPAHIAEKLQNETPDVVMFGHTHKPFAQQFGRTLYFNPGYAGKQRFDLERSVALMQINGGEISYQFVSLR